MTSNYEQELQDDFIALVGSLLKEKGFSRIMSRIYGQPQPPNLNGFTPDVYAEKVIKSEQGIDFVIEKLVVAVETETSLKDPQTNSRHKKLKQWAKSNKAVFKTVLAR